MDNNKKENRFLIIWLFCVVMLVMVSFMNFRGTRAYFGGGTTGSFTAFDVYYSSNYPDSFSNVEPVKNNQNSNIYKIIDNMFEIPEGYEFVSWNTSSDGSGTSYVAENVLKLTADLQLYAQWNLVVIDEPDNEVIESELAYGDVNLNGLIDNDDYLLLENHVNGVSILSGQALLNADVNVDSKVDLVDVDIIKQVCLGNNRYVGFFPDNPILIYDIYEGNIDVGTGDSTGETEDNEDGDGDSTSSGNGTNLGGGTGTGSTGTGNGNSGSSQGNNSSGGGNAASSGGSSNKGNNLSNKGDNGENTTDTEVVPEPEPLYYNFKFMTDDKEYSNTRCEVIDGNDCELVLPESPKRDGYIFKGWSIDKNCSNGVIINASIMVDSSNTYYACFVVDSNVDNTDRTSYVGVIVFVICLLTARLIGHLVYKFKNEEKNNSD